MCLNSELSVFRALGVAEMIVLIGGTNKNSFQRLSFTEKHSPHTKEWTPGASMPGYAKTEFATCELQNDIYISGNYTVTSLRSFYYKRFVNTF